MADFVEPAVGLAVRTRVGYLEDLPLADGVNVVGALLWLAVGIDVVGKLLRLKVGIDVVAPAMGLAVRTRVGYLVDLSLADFVEPAVGLAV